MEQKDTLEILKVIVAEQQHTAPVALTIGHTDENDFVESGGVWIADCPPAIITALQKAGYIMGMDSGRLYISHKEKLK